MKDTNKKMLFLGPLYPPERENEIKNNSKINASNAPNVFQWNLLNGLSELLGDGLKVVNVLPVGTWPKFYRMRYLDDRDWQYHNVHGQEIGCINLPYIKQYQRAQKVKRLLKKVTPHTSEILIYSAYMPFLKAVYKLPSDVIITVIVTDLPEFYDLTKTTCVRKMLRSIQNRMIYKYLERVDRFVVLTDQMYEPLHISNRPWLRMEGICDINETQTVPASTETKAILYAGTLNYQYGIKDLLGALELIDIDNTELWICGSGEAENEIRNIAQKDGRIKFFGYCTQAEVKELRSKAAVLVNPRSDEGEYTKYSFPSKTMEYMASGKPVVMYKLAGIPDEYDEYLNYVRSSDRPTYQLAETLRTVLLNYDDALAKAEKAKVFVHENKNSIAQAKKLVTFIERYSR